MASEEIQLSLFEKLGIVWAFGATAFWAGCTALRHLVLPPSDSPGVARSVYAFVMRDVMRLSPRQRKKVLPQHKTGEVIKKYCTQHRLKHVVYPLPKGAKLHWVGPQPSSGCNVFLYMHGGGYKMAINPGHLSFSLKCASNAKASLALLEYTLAPAGHYPTQLNQAIEALKSILNITSPSHITIAGDSAGGHLSTSLLSHLMHPAKDIEPIPLIEKLGGICLICPFLSFDYEKKSYVTNAPRDYLQLKDVKSFNSDFKPLGLSDTDALKDSGLSPLDAPKGWWKDCPVERILLTAGVWEVFLDDIVAFSKRLQEEARPGTKVDLVVGDKEVHAACIVDTAIGLSEGDTAKAVLAWMSNANIGF
ncbi:alpha/beta-hydrolase [Stipitochalara longipes BDJ]|nr:alpha/beta-hydrolase [Stipitochalara longipes BDJ]